MLAVPGGTNPPPPPPSGSYEWNNIYTPPSSTSWVVRTVGTSLPQTGVGSHQTEYPPVGGGTLPTYEVQTYPQDCDLLLVSDGTVLDMPLRLPARVRRLHVRGVRMSLDWDKGYETRNNTDTADYRVARDKAPWHVTFTHSLVMEGCYVHANGLAFDIVQLPNAQGDATDHATRDVFLLNSAFFHWSGVGPGFHGDLFHSADNACRNVYYENLYTETSYSDNTAYTIGGVNAVRKWHMRNVTMQKGPPYQSPTVNSNNRFGFNEELPALDNVYHPWGVYTKVDGDGGFTAHDGSGSGIRSTNPQTQDDLAPNIHIGENYVSPFSIGA